MMEEKSILHPIIVLIRSYKFILALTLVFALCGFLLSYLVPKPAEKDRIFESKINIIITPVDLRPTGDEVGINSGSSSWMFDAEQRATDFIPSIKGLSIGKVNYPSYSTVAIMNLLKSEEFLKGFQDSSGISLIAESKSGNLVFTSDIKTNSLIINLKSNNSGLAANIKEYITSNYPKIMKGKVISAVDQTLEIVNKEITIEKNNINDLAKKINQMNSAKDGAVSSSALIAEGKLADYQQLNIYYRIALQSLSNYQVMDRNLNIYKGMTADDIGHFGLQVNLEDTTPKVSQSTTARTSKSMMIAIATLLGLMASIFLVLFKDYWNTTGRAEYNGLMKQLKSK